ncbi:ribosome silencing factor [Alicyclobacillus sp. TC]|uniref:Ribosomal silencing factor RsfS n=3 Tax=Alicyclobacillaceae TaxID=186823 RepID=A0A1M6JZ91_9BACL|nr:ribosome-associated protein [Alicyclobacillus tengchongensis]QRF24631.1 ribosome silencing factor [Alicyclobacillus sp. TC]SHJ52040.1 ribosome-associated protein [Alicyclobacillus montanus]
MTHMMLSELAMQAAQAASDKKAKDVLILDIHELTPMADYFVICSANSGTQIQAVSKAIKDKMGENGVYCKGMEGLEDARWVLMDFGDIVVHIFRPEDREFYHLERLWGDAPVLSLETEAE